MYVEFLLHLVIWWLIEEIISCELSLKSCLSLELYTRCVMSYYTQEFSLFSPNRWGRLMRLLRRSVSFTKFIHSCLQCLHNPCLVANFCQVCFRYLKSHEVHSWYDRRELWHHWKCEIFKEWVLSSLYTTRSRFHLCVIGIISTWEIGSPRLFSIK